METHKMQVVIPADHRLVVEVPETIRSGPAQLILVVLEGEERATAEDNSALARWDSIMAELEADPRNLTELSTEERRQRLRRVSGMGRGILPSSEQVAREKQREIEHEEARFGS